MFIKQAVVNVSRKFFNEKQINIDNGILVQFLFLTTLKNYIYQWLTNDKIFVIPQQVRCKANQRRHILVLDMDQTLLYTRRQHKPIHSNYIRTQFEGETMFVEPRPFAKQFLKAVSQIFTVFIYTAGKKSYADTVLNIIDAEKVIQKRLYRDSCRKVDGKLVKDLKYIKKALRIKEQMFLVDDNTDSINNNYPFALKINPFQGNQQDVELFTIFQKILRLYV